MPQGWLALRGQSQRGQLPFPTRLTPLTLAYLQLQQTWNFPYVWQWFSRFSSKESGAGGGKVVNPGTEDRMWFVLNLSNVWACKEVTAGHTGA